MADLLASIALEKLTNVVQQQLTLFAGATHELEKLSSTFQSIQALFSDAESRQVAEESVHVWLSMLKHVAYDIDDVLDEGKISGLGEEGDDEGDSRNKVRQCLLSPYSCLSHVVFRYKVARRIKEIRERLDEIADDKNKYNFSISSVGGDDRTLVRRERLTSSLIDESEMIIGRESDKEMLVSRLVSGSSHEEDGGQVHVVAVVGIGGLGKTTLAQQIYHDGKVRAHFDKFLWVCVSDVFDVVRLTKEILEDIKGTSTSLSGLNSLQNELARSLRGKHFLLVLDDVWNDEEEKWKMLRLPLNSGAQGSRILVTTRSDKVANTMKATYIHELEGLSDGQSWTLFSSRAFVGMNAEERLKLESIGKEIVKKCKGVPLSIRVIGSSVNSKATVEDWESVLNSKIWSLSPARSKILPALLLTYSNLPTHLKQCFVYCSMFPKDWPLKKDTLVRLWVAQGFIRSEESREINDVGERYLDELVAWSIIQRTEVYGATRYTVHDLLHDLGEFIAKDEIHTLSSTSEGGKSDVRHAFVSFTGTGYSPSKMPFTLRGAKKLRTLFLYGAQDGSHTAMIVDLFQQSRLLRAVVFENSEISRLPNAIGKMKHLRYLDLSWSHILELTESVSHLSNLHTLNLNNCYKLKKLPRGIGRMVGLRHLQIEGTMNLEYLPKGLGRISGLQSLCKFMVGGGGKGVEGCRIDELQRLDSLHGSLEIFGLGRVSSREEAEKAQLWNKPYLRRLALWTFGGTDDDDAVTESMDNVFEGLRPHVSLEELELYWYGGSRLPSWIAIMSCLRKLEIWGCGSLGSLPDSLGQLESLQHLRIRECEKLESLPHSFGQLKALNRLEISNCHALRSLPHGLQHLSRLQQLRINACPLLSERCKKDGGEDWPKISHVPNICIDHRWK